MHTEFSSIEEYVEAIEAAAKKYSKKVPTGSTPPPYYADETIRFGVSIYRLWKLDWSKDNSFAVSVRKWLELKVRLRQRSRPPTYVSPGEAHLFKLFGVDWRSGVVSDCKSV